LPLFLKKTLLVGITEFATVFSFKRNFCLQLKWQSCIGGFSQKYGYIPEIKVQKSLIILLYVWVSYTMKTTYTKIWRFSFYFYFFPPFLLLATENLKISLFFERLIFNFAFWQYIASQCLNFFLKKRPVWLPREVRKIYYLGSDGAGF
jgi:hypothetical protein